jgi:hypothetical protein
MLITFADILTGCRRAELARAGFVLQLLVIDHVEMHAAL